MQPIIIIKADGSQAPFDYEKVLHSMQRAKVPGELQTKALKYVESNLHDGMTTGEIYHHLFDYLRKNNRPASIKYSLKKAIQDLGPSGFPFEKYVARIYEAQGYTTEVDVILKGECVEHEIDVIATREEEKIMTEVKFHNESGIHTDLKVALYVWARFMDVKENHAFTQAEIVTNTKLTETARNYAQCKNIKVLGWNYPEVNALPNLIEQFHLHPITALSEFSHQEVENLIAAGFVLCRDLLERDVDDVSRETSISHHKLTQAQEDVRGMFEN